MTPQILHGFIIEIRFLSPTNYRPARIKAVIDSGMSYRPKQYTLTRSLDYGEPTKCIGELVVALIEKYNLNYLRNSVGKMSMAPFRNGWIVSLPV